MIMNHMTIANTIDIISADLNHFIALSTLFHHKFCATKVAKAEDKFIIGIIANVSTFDAAVNHATISLQNQFITHCVASIPTDTID